MAKPLLINICPHLYKFVVEFGRIPTLRHLRFTLTCNSQNLPLVVFGMKPIFSPFRRWQFSAPAVTHPQTNSITPPPRQVHPKSSSTISKTVKSAPHDCPITSSHHVRVRRPSLTPTRRNPRSHFNLR